MRKWLKEAEQRIRSRQYIKNGDDISALKVCIELRAIIIEEGLESCPHYPKSEMIVPLPPKLDLNQQPIKHAKQTRLFSEEST